MSHTVTEYKPTFSIYKVNSFPVSVALKQDESNFEEWLLFYKKILSCRYAYYDHTYEYFYNESCLRFDQKIQSIRGNATALLQKYSSRIRLLKSIEFDSMLDKVCQEALAGRELRNKQYEGIHNTLAKLSYDFIFNDKNDENIDEFYRQCREVIQEKRLTKFLCRLDGLMLPHNFNPTARYSFHVELKRDAEIECKALGKKTYRLNNHTGRIDTALYMCSGESFPHDYAAAIKHLSDGRESKTLRLRYKTRITILNNIKFDTLLNEVRAEAQAGYTPKNNQYAEIYKKLAQLSYDFIYNANQDTPLHIAMNAFRVAYKNVIKDAPERNRLIQDSSYTCQDEPAQNNATFKDYITYCVDKPVQWCASDKFEQLTKNNFFKSIIALRKYGFDGLTNEHIACVELVQGLKENACVYINNDDETAGNTFTEDCSKGIKHAQQYLPPTDKWDIWFLQTASIIVYCLTLSLVHRNKRRDLKELFYTNRIYASLAIDALCVQFGINPERQSEELSTKVSHTNKSSLKPNFPIVNSLDNPDAIPIAVPV